MKNYKLTIEFASVGNTPPETIIEMSFKAPDLQEAERYGAHIFDQTGKFNVVPLNNSRVYYHKVNEVV